MAWGKFAGGDQCYLRDEQYRDATRLAARANLHVRYRTATVPWFRWLAAQVAWPAGGDVLEVGCGPGWLWVQGGDLLPAALRLTLTDLSPGMVAEAVERVRAAGRYAAVEGRTADAQALPFTDARFDVVVADHMLYHVPDPARAVAELRRVLRPGGVLVAATNGPRALRELWEVTAEVFGGPAEHETVAAFGSMTGRPLLLDRFASVAWHQYEDSLRCTNPSDVLAYLTSIPPGEDATPDERRALRSAVARRFALGGGIMTVTKDTGVFVASGTAGTGGLDLRARAGGTAAPGEGSGAGAAPPAERGTTPVAMTGEVP